MNKSVILASSVLAPNIEGRLVQHPNGIFKDRLNKDFVLSFNANSCIDSKKRSYAMIKGNIRLVHLHSDSETRALKLRGESISE